MRSKKIIALVLTASLINSTTNVGILVNATEKVNKNINVQNQQNEQEKFNLEENIINVHGLYTDRPEFKLKFDTSKQEIKVFDQSQNHIHKAYGNNTFWKIRILNSNKDEKLTVTLLGNDYANSDKLNSLNGFKYEYGDFIELICEEPYKHKIKGNIIDAQYPFDERIEEMDKVLFQITKDGLKAIYEGLKANKIEIAGTSTDVNFYIRFDEEIKQLKLGTNINEVKEIYKEKELYFLFELFDKDMNKKLTVNFTGDSEKKVIELAKIMHVSYEYGDVIKIYHKEAEEKLKIFGNIIDKKEEYSDGIENRENIDNTVFEITKDGLKAIYNEAPIINGVEDITVRKMTIEEMGRIGEALLLRGVSASDEKEGDITEKIKIELENKEKDYFDPSKAGEYILSYNVDDKWGRSTKKLRKFIITEESDLEKNFIRVDGFGTFGERDKFKIGFDDLNKTIKIYDQKSVQIHNLFNNYFNITIFDKSGKEKKSLTINGTDKGDSEKLNLLKDFEYDYGDLIKLWHAEPIKLHIKGNIIDATKNYSDESTGVNRNDLILEITKDGLKEVQINSPTIRGTEEIIIRKGQEINLKEGITASDEREGDITERINVKNNNLDVNTLGEYNVEYSVSNSLGKENKVNRKVTVINIPKLEENKINILGIGNDLKFVIEFDDINKKFKKYNYHEDVLHNYFGNRDYFAIKIFNNTMNEKLKINVNGLVLPNSVELNKLEDFNYEYGDFIKIYHAEPSNRFKIEGSIIDAREDYSDAVQDRENIDNTVFQITENGLKAIYNEAPVIKGINDIKVRKGSNFDLKEGITAIDDLDGDITNKLIVKSALDTSKLGDYTITYEVTDSCGRKTIVERVITVIEIPKLELNRIDLLGREYSFHKYEKVIILEDHKFKLLFDDINHTFRVHAVSSAELDMVEPYRNKKYMEIKLLDKYGKEKVSQSFLGKDHTFFSNKLSKLFSVQYDYGDILKIYHAQPEKIRIAGNVINGTEDYSDGINNINNVNEIENIGFEITENGLKYIYNSKPEIKGVKNLIIRQGENFNKLQDITAIDDRDDDITSKINVTGDLDTNQIGEYRINYTVEDSWGRQSKATSHIRVISRPKLENNFILVKGIAFKGIGDEKFKLGFDDIKKELKIYDIINNNFHIYFKNQTYFTVKILDKHRKEKKSISFIGDDFVKSDKLQELNKYKYEYGDRIKLFHAEPNRLDINGEVIDARINYSEKVWFDTNAVEFEITANGLKAIYNEAPVLTGIENTTIRIGEAFDNLEGIIVRDDHDRNLTPIVTGNVDINTLGDYELTYSVTDSWGVETTVKRIITVRSNNNPTITGVEKAIINVGQQFNNMQGVSANDIEDNDLTSKVKVKGEVNNNLVGTYKLIYTVIDSDGNKVSKARAVVVKSNYKPVITGTQNITIKEGDDFDPLFEVEARDNEDGDLTEFIDIKGNVNTSFKGVYDLIYSVKDEDKNEYITTRRIVVRSNDKPVLSGIKNSVIKVGDTFQKLLDITALDTEDGDLNSKIVVKGDVNPFKTGVYKLTYSVTDSDGNEAKKERTVTVKTNNKPVFEGVNNITIKAGEAFEPLLDVVAKDTEDGDLTNNIIVNNKVNTANPGEYEVIYSVTDSDKNTIISKRIVTVKSNEKPIFQGVTKVSLKVGDIFDPMEGISAKDTEDGDLTQAIKILGKVNTSKEGLTTLLYSVTDNDGNLTKVKRNVTVRSNNKPSILGLEDVIVKVGDTFDKISDITAYDEEDGDITDTIIIEGIVDTNKVGEYELKYKIIDSDGNEVSENRVITVRSNTNPEIRGVEGVVVKSGDVFEIMKGVIAEDVEDGDLTKELIVEGNVNTNVLGRYELIYSVTDRDGNTRKIKRIVRVRSNTNPVITGILDVELKVGDKFKPLFKVTAHDNEDGDLTHNIHVENNVNTSQVGEYEVIYTVKDLDNNIVTIPRKVKVRSNNKPVINGLDRITIKLGDTFDPLIGVSATDTEDGDISKSIKVDNKVDISRVGTYDVSYSVVDSDGNKITKKRKIKIRSNDKPTFEGINNTTIKVGDDFNPLFGVVAHDTEDGNISNLIKFTGEVKKNEVGTYDLVYSVTDSDGNEKIATRRITVRSNNNPVILGADDITIKIGESFDKYLGIVANDIENGDLTKVLSIKGDVDVNTPGIYDLIYSVTDEDNNKIKANRRVTVRTNEVPEILGIEDNIIKIGTPFDSMEGITAIDLEDDDITKNITINGKVDANKLGIYDLVYSVTDSDGNEKRATRRITVRSNDKPLITGINDVILKINDNFDKLAGVKAIDTEDKDLTSSIDVTGDVDTTKEGKYILTYSIIDSDGNKTNISRSITVKTNNKPNLTGIEDVVIKLGDEFDKLIGVEATDHEDGEINHLIKVEGDINTKVIGTYNLVYSVTDSDNNTVKYNRVVTVRSNDKPIIVGVENKVIKIGEVFNELEGIKATDTEDKDLTNSILIKGDVDTNTVGKYILSYVVKDSDSNEDIKKRVITVKSNDKPVIKGVDAITIKVGTIFDPLEGIIASDTEDGDITDILDIEGNVDTSKEGVYNLVYSITDEDGNEVRKSREITVRSNEVPSIIGADKITLKIGDTFDKLQGVSAVDKEDGDITNNITVKGEVDTNKIGGYSLFYSIVDSDRNRVTVKRRVIVKSNTKPVIHIDDITIKIGDVLDYRAGLIAHDVEDGDLTQAVSIDGNVDNTKVGIYDLTYSVKDRDGNVTNLVRKVTVRTNDIPIITGVDDVTIKLGDDFDAKLGVVVTDTEDKDIINSLNIKGNVDTNNVGTYSLVYSVVDSDGNLVSKTRNIFVRTNNKPIIKGAINTNIKVGENFDKLNNVTALDKEDGDLTGVIKISGDLDTSKAGIYELIYSVRDNDGNESNVKRQIRVRTNEQPIIEGIDDISIKLGEVFDYKQGVTAIDTEDGDLTSNIVINGSVDINTEGTYNLDYSVKDKDNNETIATRVVTVRTNTKPVIKGVDDVIIKLGDNFSRTSGVIAIDKEDGSITNLMKVEGVVNTNILGDYNITYLVEDSDGNITKVVRKVTVRSNEKPKLLGVNNIILKVGDNFDPLEKISATDTEDLDLTNKIVVEGNVDTSIADIYRLNYSVTDSDGNKVTLQRIIEVKTNEKPELINLLDATIKVGDVFERISGEIALDPEDGDISGKIECMGVLDNNTPGNYELTYSVTDSDGNKTSKIRIITVRSNDRPIISGVEDSIIKVGDTFDPMSGVNIIDTEDGVINNLVSIKGTVNTNVEGIYKLIYSVIDSDGNEINTTREIRVRSNEKPVLMGVDNITLKAGDTFDKLISITARDKEDGDLTDLISVVGDVNTNVVGVYKLTYSVTDDDGNTTSIDRVITIRSNNTPEILGVKNTTIKLGDNFEPIQGITASDTEDKDLTNALIIDGKVNTLALGTYNLTYTVTDSDGNTTKLIRKVNVRSNDKPVIIGLDDKTIKIGENFDKFLGIVVKDTEDGEITDRLLVQGDVDTNVIGDYNLSYSVIDDDGNKVVKERKITIRSNDKPKILGANNTIIKAGSTFNEMEGITASDTEDKDLTNLIQVIGKVDINKPGKYILRYKVVDRDGNNTLVNRIINVKSNEKPSILGIKDEIIKVGDAFDEIIGVIAKDKEDGDLTKKININGNMDINTVGEYELVYSVVDKDGNRVEEIRKIKVRSNDNPEILGVKNKIIKVKEELDLREGITALDTEDNDLTNAIKIKGDLNNTIPGVYEIIYSVTDSDENNTLVKRLITVESNDKPIISGVENTVIKIGDNFDFMDGVIVTDTEDGDITNKVVVKGNVDINSLGDYELKYYSTDSDGNTIEATRIVTVRSNDKPEILNAYDKTIKIGDFFDAKEDIVVIDTEDNNIQENLKIRGNVDTKTFGVYKLTYSVIDSDGNETNLDREITVVTNDKPIILGNNDVTIKVGDNFDYFADIIAVDTEDGDLTDEVYIRGKVDTTKEGIYSLQYGVIDSDKNETITTKLITVRSNEKPTIMGINNITLKIGDEFNKMEGVIAKDREDGDITSKLQVLGDVNLSEIGRYVLTYSVIDNDGNKNESKRIVRVRSNDRPILTGISNETIMIGSSFDPLEGILAEDTEDGDLTELINVQGTVNTMAVGEYKLKYSVIDDDGNETIESKTVVVRSNEKPIIQGVDIINLKVGDNFDPMANVIARDKEDGDLTKLITISGEVDTSKVGNYDLTYVVKDSDGNTYKIKRRVRVRSNEKPIFKGIEDITIKLGDDFDPLIYVEAIDEEDGNLLEKIKIEGEVNRNVVGKYELIYSVLDDDQNEIKANRIVTVRSNAKPKIIGANKVTIKVGDTFNTMEGILANDLEDGDITNLIKIEGEVNTSIADEYKLFYSVKDSDDNITTTSRIIKVRSNEKPVLSGIDNITMKVGDSFDTLSGIIAMDEEDGDISELIEVIGNVDINNVGEYELTYSITDDDNNKVISKRLVTVISNNKAIINGADDITLKQGDYFNSLANIEAVDTEDGDLTDKLKITGNVDTNVMGIYRLTYSVIDSDENETMVKRKVKVRSNEKPEIIGVDNIVIKRGNKFDPTLEVEAIDLEDGNISNLISVTGIVDSRIQGNYSLIYSVKDSDGNITSITRTVTVKDDEAPIILGIEDTFVKLRESFDIMAGVSAKTVQGDDISGDIEVIGFVDTNKAGAYKLIYLVTDNNENNIVLTRNIIVENPGEPVILGLEDIILNINSTFDPKAGIEISNLKEGQSIASIEVIGTVDTSIEGDYNLLYVITDNYGDEFAVTRVLTVTSEDALILNGAEDITLRVGDTFDPALGVVLNNYKGEDLTESLQITGMVNSNVEGVYRLVYSALDKEGDLRSTTRIIRVVDKDTPIIYGINDLILNFGDKFDPLLGITAIGANSENLNSNIKVIGKVDTNTPGSYNLLYSVKNINGKTSTVTRNIEVKNKNGNLIKGVENIILRKGDIFDPMAGVKANYKNEEEITKLIKVIGKVDTNKTGKYKLVYSLTDKKGIKAIVARAILVKSDKESLIQGVEDIEVNVGDEFNPMLGVIAKDEDNNDLTNLINIEGNVDSTKPGKYNLIYSLIDKEGIKTQITRNINVIDINAPKLIGVEDIVINDTDNFNPIEGVMARDKDGKDISGNIKIKGDIDNKNGSYNLQYSIIDEKGRELEQNRVITVEKEEKVEINKDEEKIWKENSLYDENGKAKVKKLVPHDEKPKPVSIIGLILMAIGNFIRRKKD